MRTIKSGSGLRPLTGSGSSVLVVLMLFGGPAGAQSPEEAQPRTRLMQVGYLNLNAGYQAAEHSLSQRLSLPLYDETAALDVRHVSSADMALDAAVGLRMWRSLAVGLGVTHYRTRNDVEVTGTLPHPLFYDRPREATHHPDGFDRTEIGVHLQAAWTISMADRIDVALSAGPSLFLAELDRVSAIDAREVGRPYDDVQADYGRASVRKQVPGVNVGVDLTYHLIRRLEPGTLFWTAGVGVFVRWTMGTASLDEFGPDQTIETGGLQGGAGLRFRF